jgi:hypothetical protein
MSVHCLSSRSTFEVVPHLWQDVEPGRKNGLTSEVYLVQFRDRLSGPLDTWTKTRARMAPLPLSSCRIAISMATAATMRKSSVSAAIRLLRTEGPSHATGMRLFVVARAVASLAC